MEARYRSTLWACCFANFFQAVGSCFAILYVPLRGLYGLSFTDFGILVSLNFITQVASDVLFSKPVEKYGFRPFAVAAPLVSAAGLGLFAAAPLLFPRRPFAGFCAGMFLFAAAGGLQELLLSPILDALPIPEERKARSQMSENIAWQDKIDRAAGILKTARVLSSSECMELLSYIRLGLSTGVLQGVTTQELNALMVNAQPATLMAKAGKQLDQNQRDILRAQMAREACAKIKE